MPNLAIPANTPLSWRASNIALSLLPVRQHDSGATAYVRHLYGRQTVTTVGPRILSRSMREGWSPPPAARARRLRGPFRVKSCGGRRFGREGICLHHRARRVGIFWQEAFQAQHPRPTWTLRHPPVVAPPHPGRSASPSLIAPASRRQIIPSRHPLLHRQSNEVKYTSPA
ncbi:hypothetical protein EJ06DRAFT_33177 [Trichodelitschia bisporula]|uniref:Uncharacterized protein n=1 Tax=Trichodelitschia bisporula TaxID=703511 RepID=A0A6G1HUJ9_9PEZI|nr:hypothetical protein EJ06DRAFT_33177 [Trichodelitschia bisporula]